MSSLILGDRGFIGRRTKEEMIRRGIDFSLLNKRLLDDEIYSWDDDIDSIIFLAWKDVWSDEREVCEKNIQLTNEVLNITKKSNVKKIIFPSTVSVYQHDNIITEDNILSPRSEYSRTKLEAEDMIIKYCEENEINYIILRYTSIYGPNQRGGFVHDTFNDCRNGKNISFKNIKSDFIFIDDAVEANILSLGYNGSGIFNIGLGKSYNRKRVANLINELSRNKSSINTFGKPNEYGISIQKANEILGYEPKIDIENGLLLTSNYFSRDLL